MPRLAVVPVAIAYEFLEEPRPEILVRFGPARVFEDARQSAAALTGALEKALERELDAVQAAILERRFDGFRVLIAGATSASLVYDRVRAIRAWWPRRADPRRHGDVVSDPRRVDQ